MVRRGGARREVRALGALRRGGETVAQFPVLFAGADGASTFAGDHLHVGRVEHFLGALQSRNGVLTSRTKLLGHGYLHSLTDAFGTRWSRRRGLFYLGDGGSRLGTLVL